MSTRTFNSSMKETTAIYRMRNSSMEGLAFCKWDGKELPSWTKLEKSNSIHMKGLQNLEVWPTATENNNKFQYFAR